MATTQLWPATPSPSIAEPPEIGRSSSSLDGVDPAAVARMMPEVYEQLRRLAAAYLRSERTGHTFQPTALVHEAYLQLLGQRQFRWEDPGHFIGLFARLMRQTLKNHAIARNSLKRGGADRMATMIEYYETNKVDVSALDDALQALEAQDERQARIVELRFFGGLTLEEIAAVLKISLATVKRDWTLAKVWLRRELAQSQSH